MKMYKQEREEVATFMRRLYEQRLTTTSGGNVSMKIGDYILITPSQTDKGRMKGKEVGIINADGKNLTPELKPTMESRMHLAVYNERHDVKAIVHAHPVFATSFCISRKKIRSDLAGETRAVIGVPVRANYELMGTKMLADVVAEASKKGNVVLMENHGVLAVGNNLLQAFDRLEVTEAAAKMTFITDYLGNKRQLSIDELKQIDALFK